MKNDQREENRTGKLLEIIYPEDTNSQGTLFGGHALSLMDRLAFIVASRLCPQTGSHSLFRKGRVSKPS